MGKFRKLKVILFISAGIFFGLTLVSHFASAQWEKIISGYVIALNKDEGTITLNDYFKKKILKNFANFTYKKSLEWYFQKNLLKIMS